MQKIISSLPLWFFYFYKIPKCINKDENAHRYVLRGERDREKEKGRRRDREEREGEREGRGIERERVCERDRETGLDIENKIKKYFILYLLQNKGNLKKNILILKFYINRICTPKKSNQKISPEKVT